MTYPDLHSIKVQAGTPRKKEIDYPSGKESSPSAEKVRAILN
jgi:hypothetical protein